MAPAAYKCASASGCAEFVYVDTYDTTRDNYPYFVPNGFGGYNTGTADVLSWPEDTSYNPGAGLEHVVYTNLPAGQHRFRFSDNTHSVVLDTTVMLAAGHKTIMYVNDSLNAYYRLIALDETGTGPTADAGPRIRMINFSPSVGPLNVYVLGDTGQRIYPSSLPERVPFDSVTPYVTLDSASLALEDGNIYMYFFAGTDTTNTLASIKLPAASGRSYHVVFFGYTANGFLPYPAHGSGPAPSPVFLSPDEQAWIREIF